MRNVSIVEHTKKAPERIKVAAYARVSAESDRLAHSLSAQVSYYSSLIQNNPKWEFAGIFADFGISGTSVNGRKEFQRMIGACEAGKIQLILTKSISRFARNSVDLLKTVRHLKDLGIEVRFEKENLSSFSDDGELFMTLLAAFAEEESRSQSNNMKWAIRKKFQKGEPMHRPAFGYRWDGENFVIVPEEAEAVRKIFSDFLNDVPLGRTSRWLKDQGFRATTKTFIRYALQNPVYTGGLLLQRYFTADVLTHECRKNNGELPMYRVEDHHPAIIDKETFDSVQAKIRSSYEFNKEAHRIVKPKCFSAKLVCGCCGANYVSTRFWKNRKTGEMQEGWTCFRKIKSRGKECRSKRIIGERLREECSRVLGMESFDEDTFTQTVEKIIVGEDGSLDFYLYGGERRTGRIKFYDSSERKHQDPHSKKYGYTCTEDGYVICEPEAEAVRLVFQHYNAGMTISDISRKMEAAGYKTVRGQFSRGTVRHILGNEFYLGRRVYPANYSGTGKEETVENDHPAIISRDDFEKARVRRESDAKRHNDSRNH